MLEVWSLRRCSLYTSLLIKEQRIEGRGAGLAFILQDSVVSCQEDANRLTRRVWTLVRRSTMHAI